MAFTETGSNQLLRMLIGQNSSSLPTGSNCYIALSTTTPSADGTNFTEPNKNGYARVLIGTYNSSATYKMNTPASGTTSNKEAIFFPVVTNTDDNNG